MHLALRMGRTDTLTDMTTGGAVSQIVRFSMPLVIGNLFQQLYSMVDAVVVGKFVSVEALAAVGCISWVCWLINAFLRDCGNAFSITASVAVGAKDTKQLKKIIGNAVIVCVVLGAVTTLLLLLAVPWILEILSVQSNVIAMTRRYLTVYILLIPAGLVFNITASLLRACGNSNVTFVSMTVSTAVNIALDLLFVLGLGAGVLGAAIATWIAQTSAMAVALLAARKEEAFRIDRADLKPDPELLGQLLRLWLPMLLNSLVLAFGGLFVERKTNQMGSSFTAGISACSKIFSLLDAIIIAFQTGLSVYVGQNRGAGLAGRLRDGVNRMIAFGIALTAGMILVVFAVQQWLLPLFLSANNPETYQRALQVANDDTHILMITMLFMTPMYFYRVALQTLGHSEFAAVGGVIQMAARIVTVQFGPALIGEYAYYLHDGMAWLFCLPMMAVPCYYYMNQLCRKEKEPSSAGP